MKYDKSMFGEWSRNFNLTRYFRPSYIGQVQDLCSIYENSRYPYSEREKGYSCLVYTMCLDDDGKEEIISFQSETLELAKFKCDLILKERGFEIELLSFSKKV
jgi:hypothetical protein